MSVLQSLVTNSRTLQTERTRLGGSVSLLEMEDGRHAYLKAGSGPGCKELEREAEALTNLQSSGRVPQLLAFDTNGEQAGLLTVAAPGEPLHRLAEAEEKALVIEVLADVLDELWSPRFEDLSWSDPVSDELSDIETLICDPGFDSQLFQDLTAWSSVDEALSWAREEVAKHERDVFTHGDLCLPNILWDDSAATWWLVDVGSAGKASRYRDLSAIAGSLNRNLGDGAFLELISRTGIPDDPQKRAVYELLDHFWSADKRLG